MSGIVRIASRDNPFYKSLVAVARDAGTARGGGRILLDGVHLADAFLAAGGAPREAVVGESALGDPEVAALLARTGLAPRVLADALVHAVSGLAHALPLLMVVDRPRAPTPVSSIARTAVVLDRVQDPGNVGSILRSAAAADVAEVHLSPGTAAAWSPKVLRAAMGAHFGIDVHEQADLPALRAGTALPWIATAPHASRSLFDADLRGDVVWVFGHEGRGVDGALVDPARAVRIPQPGAIESLNVAACAAICLFEQVRQRASA